MPRRVALIFRSLGFLCSHYWEWCGYLRNLTGKVIFKSVNIYSVLKELKVVLKSCFLTLRASTKKPANFLNDAYEPFLWTKVIFFWHMIGKNLSQWAEQNQSSRRLQELLPKSYWKISILLFKAVCQRVSDGRLGSALFRHIHTHPYESKTNN